MLTPGSSLVLAGCLQRHIILLQLKKRLPGACSVPAALAFMRCANGPAGGCKARQSSRSLGSGLGKEGLVARNQAELPANLTGMGCSRPVTTRCTACNAAYG